MKHYVNFCVNLDNRDSEGKPRIIKTPKDIITISNDDTIYFSISVIEDGVETDLKTARLWKDVVGLEEVEEVAQ